jgi:hypothetical protein
MPFNAQLQVFGAVRWLAAGNLSTQEIFARLERLSGYRLYACTTQRGPLPTIRTWLEHDRQTDKAAQALHIHPNTLLYRVRRFEQITGRSLASTEVLAETWLALRAAATLSARQLYAQ